MANWTASEVGEWLKKNSFDMLIKSFKERNIDGNSLLALTDAAIEQMISRRSYDEEKNKLVVERFKYKVNELKIQQSANVTKRAQKPSSSSRTSTSVPSDAPEASHTASDTDTTYERSLTISHDHPRVDMRFFHNPFFCQALQLYLSKKFRITLSTKFERQELILNMIGSQQNVTEGLDAMRNIFQSTETKIYNSETTDRKAIYWCQHIFSNSAIEVIQQIMNNERIFTVWEKTDMFSGYYRVLYLNHELFNVSSENIIHILNHEIDYVENIQMPNEKTKKFMEEIQKFISENRQNELSIIQHKYPDKLDIKINLFGRKKLVKTVKKKLQLLVNKYMLTKFEINMTTRQHEHLIDNCFHQLKDLERKYNDDGVIIHTRQKEFYAPQYLIDEIKQQINEFICRTAVCMIQKIGDRSSWTDDNNAQLTQIVKKYGCRVEKIDSKEEIQTYPIPVALSKTTATSSLLVEQSNQFCSILSVRKSSVANGSVEIRKGDRSMYLSSDITVVSTDAGAAEQRIPTTNDNVFFETKSNKNIFYKQWSPPSASDIEKQYAKQKRSIVKFIGAVFENIIINCPNATTIAFSMAGWQNFTLEQQLIESLLLQTKQEMEARKSKWRVLFIFSNEQNDLYNKFNEVMKRLQSNEDGFAQYSCPTITIKITIATSKEYDLSTCEQEVNNYIQIHLARTETLKNATELVHWDQHMINAFHRYCLDKSVLVHMDLTINQLRLIGSAEDVNKTIEKYRLLSKIVQLKSSIRIPPSVKPRSTLGEKQTSETSSKNGYNIAFSYCQQDQAICDYFLGSLLGEGYLVCQPASSGSLSKSRIDRSDLLLLYFSENYAQDTSRIADVNYAKSSGKTIVPIAEMRKPFEDSEENSWLHSMTMSGLFYDIFNHEIELEFTGDFNLEYDKLLAALLRYTKPGVTGQQYKQSSKEIHPVDTEYEEPTFGHVSLALQKVTTAQYKEQEKAYKSQLKKRMEKEKFADAELNELVGVFILVVDDLEAILRGENVVHDASLENESIQYYWQHKLKEHYSPVHVNDLLSCIKRWMEKAPHVIKKNIAPFTPTGDINDALFLTPPRTTSFDWITQEDEHVESALEVRDYFSTPISNPGSWFTNDQAHDYMQQMIKADGRRNLVYTTIDKNEVVWDANSFSGVVNTGESNKIGNELKNAEELKKLEELDNPNKLWKVKKRMRHQIMKRVRKAFDPVKNPWRYRRDGEEIQESINKLIEEEGQVAEGFLKQKLKNAAEFEKLCNH